MFPRKTNKAKYIKLMSDFIPPPFQKIMPGPPFAFGTILVIMALLVAIFIPDEPKNSAKSPTRRNAPSTELEVFHRDTGEESLND